MNPTIVDIFTEGIHCHAAFSSVLPLCLSDADTPWTNVNSEETHYIVFRDTFPITPGHLLFVPRVNTIHGVAQAFESALRFGKEKVDSGSWDAYNIGMNCGTAAGQTVMWPHIHLIPRFNGDVKNPRGGVRNLLQNGLGDYADNTPKLRPDGGN